MHHRLTAALAGALASVVLIPAAADAATRTVSMGPPPKDAKTLNDLNADGNQFYPSTTTVRVGDSVRFVPYGFHNVDLLKRGSRTGTPLFSPQGAVSGVNDAAGAPFWFNGQPALGFTPSLLRSNFGKTVSFSGAKAFNTGLPLGPAKPATVRFTRTGSFTYLCDVHSGMKGKVNVRSRRASLPSNRSHTRRAARELAAVKKAARTLASTPVPANTVLLGAYKSGADLFAMLPKRLTVPVGTTVTFAMDNGSREAHTATFGPGDGMKGTGYVGEIAKSFESPNLDPRGTYPSETPGTIGTLTPALHGNGFWNSGVLVGQGKVPGLPSTTAVRFGQAGTYPYLCVIHPHMTGEVVVQ